MTTTTAVQRGLFGKDYEVQSDCHECGERVVGKVYEDVDGNPVCSSCFDDLNLIVCASCDKVVERDDCRENPDGDLWCDECIDAGCSTCERCDEAVWSDDIGEVNTRNGRNRRTTSEYWCEFCRDNHTFTCDDCDCSYDRNDSISTAGGSSICQSCYENYYFTCEGCDEVYHCDEMASCDAGCYCDGCRPHGVDFDPGGFRNRSGCVTETGSARCFGVELETDDCNGYEDLEGSRAWGAKDDPTCNGKEFYSDILSGDEGLDAIREWGKMADNNGWRADSGCGYHLHLDARDESDDSLFAAAYAYRATQEVWLSFVSRPRRNSSYSSRCDWDCADVDIAQGDGTFYSFSNRNSRYYWCNIRAYHSHNTFEIRAHDGTCNKVEVINWVKAHTRFMDWACALGYDSVKEALDGKDDAELLDLIVREAWQDDELRDYYAKKADLYRQDDYDAY